MDGRDVVVPFGADEINPVFNCAVLIPWPNRLRDGAYEYGGVEDGHCVVLAHAAPIAAELPRAEADDAHGAAGPAEHALFHGPAP